MLCPVRFEGFWCERAIFFPSVESKWLGKRPLPSPPILHPPSFPLSCHANTVLGLFLPLALIHILSCPHHSFPLSPSLFTSPDWWGIYAHTLTHKCTITVVLLLPSNIVFCWPNRKKKKRASDHFHKHEGSYQVQGAWDREHLFCCLSLCCAVTIIGCIKGSISSPAGICWLKLHVWDGRCW